MIGCKKQRSHVFFRLFNEKYHIARNIDRENLTEKKNVDLQSHGISDVCTIHINLGMEQGGF